MAIPHPPPDHANSAPPFRAAICPRSPSLRRKSQVVEENVGWRTPLDRQLYGSHRQISLAMLGRDGRLLLRFRRPFTWLSSAMYVEGPYGELVGEIRRGIGLPPCRSVHFAFLLVTSHFACLFFQFWRDQVSFGRVVKSLPPDCRFGPATAIPTVWTGGEVPHLPVRHPALLLAQ